MRYPLFILILFLFSLIACSQDQPAPVAPAGKAQGDDLGALLDLFGQLEPDSPPAAQPDTTQADTTSQANTAPPEVIDADSVWTDESDFAFDIELIFANSVPQIDRNTFQRAVDHIEHIILNDLPDVELPSTYHTVPLVHKGRQVDDLLILVRSRPESNTMSFGVEAYAELLHESFGRVTYGENSHQILRNTFKSNYQYATQEELIEQQMYEVFLHEIIHLLGVGSSGEWLEQIRHRTSWANPPPQHKIFTFYLFNFFYIGPQALTGFTQVKRTLMAHDHFAKNTLYHGDYIPVDDDRHHWLPISETNLDILTGTIHYDENGHLVPRYISPITRGALRDLGYEVAEVDSIRINATKSVLPIPVTGKG